MLNVTKMELQTVICALESRAERWERSATEREGERKERDAALDRETAAEYQTLADRLKGDHVSDAVASVVRERLRQVTEKGWTPEHDDTHPDGSMAAAAACYAMNAAGACESHTLEEYWPWGIGWWKPKDRRRDLERAGALIIAELERLDRQEAKRT